MKDQNASINFEKKNPEELNGKKPKQEQDDFILLCQKEKEKKTPLENYHFVP